MRLRRPQQKLGPPPTAADLERLDCVTLSFARSGGAGGQNVNKLSTKCVARLHIDDSPWTEAVRARLRVGATNDGDVVVSADTQRTQAANKKDALERLAARVDAAWRPPKQRRMRSGISEGGKRQRREDKKKTSQKKAARRRLSLGHVRFCRRGG